MTGCAESTWCTAFLMAAAVLLGAVAVRTTRLRVGTGIFLLAGIIGFADIDPFVLNMAQGGAGGLSNAAVAGAVLIATSSNNVLKAGYALALAGRRPCLPPAIALGTLAILGVVAGLLLGSR